MMTSIFAPFGRTIYFLGGFTLIAVVKQYMQNDITYDLMFHFFATVGFSALPVILFVKIFKRKISPERGIITALLLFLAFDYQFGWYGYVYGALAIFIALTIEHFFFIKGEPVVESNSASLLLIAAITPFFAWGGYDITWWGLELPDLSLGSVSLPLTSILLLVWLYMNVEKWEKIHLVLFFFLSALLSLGLFQYQQGSIQDVLSDPILLFIIAFFLTNPHTAPSEQKTQVLIGIIAGFLFAFFLTHERIPEIFSNHAALASVFVTSIIIFVAKIISSIYRKA